MTHAERTRRAETFAKGCTEALALLNGPMPTEGERREAAAFLRLTHMLPDAQSVLAFDKDARDA